MAAPDMRTGHGSGAGMPHLELPWDEQTPANPDVTAANLAEQKKRGRPFELRNRAAADRPPTLANGVSVDGLPEPTRAELRRSTSYRQRRVRETCAVTGYVSAGSTAIFQSAALTLLSHRRVMRRALETDDPALHKLAADLADKHAQLEHKARILAKDEAAGRPRENVVDRIRRELMAAPETAK